jgi:hypothetical protein
MTALSASPFAARHAAASVAVQRTASKGQQFP